jgi:hypothetical protein
MATIARVEIYTPDVEQRYVFCPATDAADGYRF